MEGVFLPLVYHGEVGSVCEDIGAFLHSVSPGNSDIWVGDVGSDTPYGADPAGGGPPLGGETDHDKIPPDPYGWKMYLTSVGGGHVGSRA